MDSSTPTKIPKSNLLNLPPEIRLLIYSFVFGQKYSIYQCCFYSSSPFQHHSAQLLRTCRKIHDEARVLLYKPFVYKLCTHPRHICDFLDIIGASNAKLIRCLKISEKGVQAPYAGHLHLNALLESRQRINITSFTVTHVLTCRRESKHRLHESRRTRRAFLFMGRLIKSFPQLSASRVFASCNYHNRSQSRCIGVPEHVDLRLVAENVKMEPYVSFS